MGFGASPSSHSVVHRRQAAQCWRGSSGHQSSFAYDAWAWLATEHDTEVRRKYGLAVTLLPAGISTKSPLGYDHVSSAGPFGYEFREAPL
jgi:hypothetical protein